MFSIVAFSMVMVAVLMMWHDIKKVRKEVRILNVATSEIVGKLADAVIAAVS